MGLLQALNLSPPARPPLLGAGAGPFAIAINKPGRFEPGTEQQLAVTALYSGGPPRDVTGQVKWQSSVEALVKVLPGGLAKVGRGRGPVTITATLAGSKPDSVEVMVQARLEDIVITPASPLVESGETIDLTATAVYADRSTEDIAAKVEWSSDDKKVADFPEKGKCKAGEARTVRVFASDADAEISGMTKVTVFAKGRRPPPLKVTIAPLNPDVRDPTQIQFRATGHYPGNATHEITHLVVWESSHPNLLAISVDGLGIPGLGSGKALIRGLDRPTGKFQATTAYVAMPGVEKITVARKQIEMEVGQTVGLRVMADFHGGGQQMRVNRLVRFTPSVAGVATVSRSGANVKGDAPGETDFEVVEPLSGASDSFHVKVEPAVVP